MTTISSDRDLLHEVSERLGIDAETLMERYYGSIEDGRHEMDEFVRTGRLQASFAELLRVELGSQRTTE